VNERERASRHTECLPPIVQHWKTKSQKAGSNEAAPPKAGPPKGGRRGGCLEVPLLL